MEANSGAKVWPNPASHLIVAGGLMLAVAMVSVRMLED